MPKANMFGAIQSRMIPIARDLVVKGHPLLAVKAIIYATRTDIAIHNQARARARYNKKIVKALEELEVLETHTNQKLYPLTYPS